MVLWKLSKDVFLLHRVPVAKVRKTLFIFALLHPYKPFQEWRRTTAVYLPSLIRQSGRTKLSNEVEINHRMMKLRQVCSRLGELLVSLLFSDLLHNLVWFASVFKVFVYDFRCVCDMYRCVCFRVSDLFMVLDFYMPTHIYIYIYNAPSAANYCLLGVSHWLCSLWFVFSTLGCHKSNALCCLFKTE